MSADRTATGIVRKFNFLRMKVVGKILLVGLLASALQVITLASVVASAPAKIDPPRVRWKDSLVKIAVSSSLTQPSSNLKTESDVLGALRRSLQSWEAVADIDITFEPASRQNVSPTGIAGDGVSLITIAQTPENVLLFSKSSQTESAKTRVFYNRKGQITEADIVLNPYQQFSTDGTFGTFDLEATLTHEIGHLLGLRHSAVLGSTMSNSISKNGIFGFADFGVRSLAESDIAAIRELYGAVANDTECCGVVAGRITAGRAPRPFRVWAEDNANGRVIAQMESAADGSFRLGGLPEGTFAVFWQPIDESGAFQIGELGLVNIVAGETRLLNRDVSVRRANSSLNFVGIHSQLADTGIALTAGREHTVFIGGNNLDPKNLTIEFNSRYLRVAGGSVSSQDFGEGISVISFLLTVDSETPAGDYSIFTIARGDVRSSLIGAITIE